MVMSNIFLLCILLFLVILIPMFTHILMVIGTKLCGIAVKKGNGRHVAKSKKRVQEGFTWERCLT